VGGLNNIASAPPVKVSADASGLDDPKAEIEMLKTSAASGAMVAVSANTAGLEAPKAEIAALEKPVIVPVTVEMQSQKDSMNASILGGGDKTGISVRVPVSVDTAAMGAEITSAQAELDKVPLSKTVTLSLDTAGFDTKIDGIKTKLAGLPDESISININVPSLLKLPDFSALSSKSLSISADPSTAMGAIKRVNDAAINPKTLMIYGNETDAQIAMDAIDNDSLEAKTLMIGADNGEALKAMYAVQDYEIFGKTVDVFGSNGSAMGAITAVRTALDNLHDKTIYINVVQTAPPANSSGSPDDRDNPDRQTGNLRDTAPVLADATRGSGKIADTIIVNDERHLEQLIIAVMDKRLNR
jgi:hypothetical protein